MYLPVKVGTPILKDLGQGNQDEGEACHDDDDVQDGGDGAEVSGRFHLWSEDGLVGAILLVSGRVIRQEVEVELAVSEKGKNLKRLDRRFTLYPI